VPLEVRWAFAHYVSDGGISRVEVHGDWVESVKSAELEG
jgi:hypothetical protein